MEDPDRRIQQEFDRYIARIGITGGNNSLTYKEIGIMNPIDMLNSPPRKDGDITHIYVPESAAEVDYALGLEFSPDSRRITLINRVMALGILEGEEYSVGPSHSDEIWKIIGKYQARKKDIIPMRYPPLLNGIEIFESPDEMMNELDSCFVYISELSTDDDI